VDNLNKLFRVYNATMWESGEVDHNVIHSGPYTDLKNFFMEAMQIENGGSMSIVTSVTESTTEIERHLKDDFFSICNVVKEI